MKVKIGEITKIRTGKLDANASSENGKYPFFTCSKEPLKISTYSYECECILVAGNGDLNVKYYNGKFDAYQRTYIIEDDSDGRLYMPYLYYFLDRYVEELRRQAIGGVIKYIKIGNLTDALVELPDVEEQKRIVFYLERVRGVLSNRENQIKLLDTLIKSRFVEMFGDLFVNENSYTECNLEELADIVSGITKGRKTSETDLVEVPYMAVSNVKDGYIDWTTVKTIFATKAEVEQYKLMPDDILMTEGGDPDKVGRGAIIRQPLKNCIHQNHIFRVRLDRKQLVPEFFEQYLQNSKAKRYFLGCAKQTTGIASINMGQLRKMSVLMPPLELQEQFAAFVQAIDKSKFIMK